MSTFEFCDTVTVPRKIDTADSTTFGVSGNAKTYLTGLVDGTISIAGKFDATATTGIDTILAGILGQDTPVNFEYQASNAAASATNPRWSGSCILTDYSLSLPVGGVVAFMASRVSSYMNGHVLVVDGGLTETFVLPVDA